MSAASKPGSAPDVQLTEIVEERLAIYRNVAKAAMTLPRPLNNGNQNMVDDAKLARLWSALDALTDHSEDLETLL